MKKLFTLAAAVLASLSLWADDPTLPADAIPTSTYDAKVKDANLYAITDGVSDGKQYFVYDLDTIRTKMKSGNVTWVKGPKNDGGNSAGTISFADGLTDADKFGFNTTWNRAWGINNSRYAGIRVTNCAEFAALTKSNSTSSGKTLYIQVFVKNADSWDFVETIGEDVYNNSKYYVLKATLDDTKEYVILLTSGNSSNCLTAQIRFANPTCTDPELTVSPTEGTGFVDDPIDIAVTSKNQSTPINAAVTVNGVPGVYGTDYTFSASTGLVQATPLKAGTFVIKFSQASNDTYCDAEESATFVISEKTPVASVTIDGPASGFIGDELVYTATATGATAYEWYLDDVKQGSDSAKFIYTAVKGEHSIVCKARNEFNAEDAWIASDAKVVKAYTLHGELIKATHTGSTTATVTGIIGGTADKNTSSDGKLNTGNYFGITLASGNFQAGDTLNVNLSAAASGGSCILVVYADKEATQEILNTGIAGVAGDNKLVLPSAANNKNSLYIVRNDDNGNWNGKIASMAVIRPMAIKSTVVSLSAVTINDVAISESDLNKLVSGSSHTLILEDSYINAPVVKFTKHTVITYEDDSQKESDEVIEVTSQQSSASTWGASVTIGETTYFVNTVKTMSYVVTYMFGTEELGTENVEANGSPAEYADYQSAVQLATFVDWYTNADLAEEHKVANIAAEVITANTTYYAKFNYKYATSINIEKAVMEHGTKYGIIAQLGAQNYASNITGSLDSLATKDDGMRNYAYLGLKVKQSGALLNFRLAAGKTVKIKFGNVAKTPQASINGSDYANITITDKVYTYTAEAEALISIKMMDGNAVVFQQIAIDEELADPELFAITCAEAENGTVVAPFKLGIPGETVTLTVTPEDGYKVASVTVNGDAIEAVETVYSFVMPAAAANVAATFSTTTALDNTEASVKATKRIVNGQLFIEKNGVIYNAQGVVVK